MTIKIPIRTVYSGSDPVGLSEFQSGEAIGYTHGGTGLSTLGNSGQILKVNSGGTALEWANDDQRDLSTYITSATVSSTYVANTIFQSALANTNSYIAATVATNLAELANTNLYIASVESNERAALANTNLYIDTKFSSANLSITTSAITITSDQGSLDQNDKILANPDGFVTINIGGTNYKLPYYS